MNMYLIPALAAGALATAALGFAGTATAETTSSTHVQDTVRTLESGGYHVIVNRIGTVPLSTCTITSIHPGHTFSTVDSRGGSSPVETIMAKTVLIDVAC
jgi:hypothetical protein